LTPRLSPRANYRWCKMLPSELKKSMSELGLSNKDMATITGKTERQVTSWLSGVHPVPRLVAILIHGLQENQIDREWLLEIVCSELRAEADLLA
jgi:hypothetical protein